MENNHGTHTPAERGASAGKANAKASPELRDALEDVSTSLNDFYQAADAFASEQARARPRVLLGVAAGVGFVLGGGLASRLGGAIMNAGGRMVAAKLIEEWLGQHETR